MMRSLNESGMIDISVVDVDLIILVDSEATTNTSSKKTRELLKAKHINCHSSANPSCK